MFRRLLKVLVSMTAVGAIIIALLIVVSVVGQKYQFSSTPSADNIDVLILRGDNDSPIQCHRDGNRFTLETNNDGEIIGIRPFTNQADMEHCIEAFKSGTLPFDPRNYIGRYEAGYISWEGTDFTNIYDWDLPQECEPHYQFKGKSHPWLIDALGLVDIIEVTFKWTGTDAEWETCFTARQKRIAEIDLSVDDNVLRIRKTELITS